MKKYTHWDIYYYINKHNSFDLYNMANLFKKLKNIFHSSTSTNQKYHSTISWYGKKRIYPIDAISYDTGYDTVAKRKLNGLKLASPFIVLIIVCIIVAAI